VAGFVNTGILKQPNTKHLESRLEVIQSHSLVRHSDLGPGTARHS